MAGLASNVRELRQRAGLACRELDRRAGLAEGHTALIEAGNRRNVQLDTLRRLATALNVTLTDLTK
jgi:DNA-binding Xre family transcriptional regulator